jgi:hypothetical protein
MAFQDCFRGVGRLQGNQTCSNRGHEQAGGVYDAPSTKTSGGFTLELTLLVRSHEPSVACREDDAGSLASAKGPPELGVLNEIFRVGNRFNSKLLTRDRAIELLPLYRISDLGYDVLWSDPLVARECGEKRELPSMNEIDENACISNDGSGRYCGRHTKSLRWRKNVDSFIGGIPSNAAEQLRQIDLAEADHVSELAQLRTTDLAPPEGLERQVKEPMPVFVARFCFVDFG